MSLLLFYQDKNMRAEVQEYITQYLKDEAVRRVFAKEDVTAVSDAKDLLDGAFYNLETLYGKENSKQIINEAR